MYRLVNQFVSEYCIPDFAPDLDMKLAWIPRLYIEENQLVIRSVTNILHILHVYLGILHGTLGPSMLTSIKHPALHQHLDFIYIAINLINDKIYLNPLLYEQPSITPSILTLILTVILINNQLLDTNNVDLIRISGNILGIIARSNEVCIHLPAYLYANLLINLNLLA